MTSSSLAAAYALDWICGDPGWLPHPVRLIGRAIAAGERRLLRPGNPQSQVLRGAILTGSIVAATCLSARLLSRQRSAETVLAWTALATRNLLDESAAVLEALGCGDLETARRFLSRIVGRDTEALDEPEILRAVIETLAESLCDGVVAPLFYLAIGGAPLAMAFKAASTLDSMIGHRETPYLYFGRVAARLDDIANFVPARITATAILAVGRVFRPANCSSVAVFRSDRHKHPSPNAGQCEAAMAGALAVRLGGLNFYAGKPSIKPELCLEGRTPTRADARAALRIVGVASIAVFAGAWLCLRWWERRR